LNLIIINKQKIIDKQKEDLEATDKQLRKEKRKNKFKKFALGVSVALNAVLILLAL
jgi:hypothetical protein